MTVIKPREMAERCPSPEKGPNQGYKLSYLLTMVEHVSNALPYVPAGPCLAASVASIFIVTEPPNEDAPPPLVDALYPSKDPGPAGLQVQRDRYVH